MRTHQASALCIAATLAATSFASAQDYSYTVGRGETIRIFSWAFFDKSCNVMKRPKIRATKAPKLGKLASGKGGVKINTVSENRLRNCLGKTVDGTIVTYSAGQTAGSDEVRLSRERLNGPNARYTIAITVK